MALAQNAFLPCYVCVCILIIDQLAHRHCRRVMTRTSWSGKVTSSPPCRKQREGKFWAAQTKTSRPALLVMCAAPFLA